jgi:ketol-acid reductoisomerase
MSARATIVDLIHEAGIAGMQRLISDTASGASSLLARKLLIEP